MATFENKAAWIAAAQHKCEVEKGPTPNPSEDEVVIKVAYAAVNPVDWKLQDHSAPFIKYPYIPGTDVAGTIVALGSIAGSRFTLGQRVIGHCDGILSGKPTNNGFQLYSTCKEILVSVIPDSLPLVNAAVLPLSISTAATALFLLLEAPLPSLNPKQIGKKVLVWGGSSSVGSSTIQLAVAAGLEVVTTASNVNHSFVKSLGATHVFDYKDTDVLESIAGLLKPGDLVVDTIGDQDTQAKCAQILAGIGGGKLPLMMPPLVTFPDNVEAVLVNSLSPGLTAVDIGDAVWRKYIPKALGAGKYQAKPDPFVITGGLEKVQYGIDLLRKGVSAKKLVIEISRE